MQTTTKPVLPPLFPARAAVPQATLLTPTPLNMHKRLPTGGSLQTAVSDAPPLHPANLHSLIVGRIRYSTRVSGPLAQGNETGGAANPLLRIVFRTLVCH